MRKYLYNLVMALLLAWCLPVFAQTVPAGYHEDLRLEITNQPGAPVRASRDGGRIWLEIARVVSGCGKVNPAGFRASSWAPPSSVAATAANAIHLKIANDPRTGRAAIFSLIPRGQIEGDAELQAAIMLDTGPGLGVFGGLGPTVGSPVYLWTAEKWQSLPADYHPKLGDRLLIVRMVPDRPLRYLDFENVFGGRITATYADGTREIIGHVLEPVTGIGRFEGTQDADCGRLRANHPGVLDVSTAPHGMIGGFQIIPWDHANDAEMSYVRTNHQWMVVGPVNMTEGSEEARAPLFFGSLYPSWRPDDLDAVDWCDALLSRCLVLCQRAGVAQASQPASDGVAPASQLASDDWHPTDLSDNWELLPEIAFSKQAPVHGPRPKDGKLWLIHEPASIYEPLPPAASRCLEDITAFRISLPLAEYWPGGDAHVAH
jgi:hypothetical protein